MKHLPLLLLLTLAIAGVVGFIIMDARSQEAPEPTISSSSSESASTATAPTHDLNFLNSLSSFTSREIPTQTITVYKQSPTLSLSFLYSPFTNHIGFASSITYKLLNVGFMYTDTFYFSLGLTLTF